MRGKKFRSDCGTPACGSATTRPAMEDQAASVPRALLQASSDAIFAKDGVGRFILFNRQVEEVAAHRTDAELGRMDAELFGAE